MKIYKKLFVENDGIPYEFNSEWSEFVYCQINLLEYMKVNMWKCWYDVLK